MTDKIVTVNVEEVAKVGRMFGIDASTDDGMKSLFKLFLVTFELVGKELEEGKVIVSTQASNVKSGARLFVFPKPERTLRLVK